MNRFVGQARGVTLYMKIAFGGGFLVPALLRENPYRK